MAASVHWDSPEGPQERRRPMVNLGRNYCVCALGFVLCCIEKKSSVKMKTINKKWKLLNVSSP